jgi:hypothetical protein
MYVLMGTGSNAPFVFYKKFFHSGFIFGMGGVLYIRFFECTGTKRNFCEVI